jgi:hypothetical protein
VSWSSKKQTFVALSTVETENVVAGQCYAQLPWMSQTLRDFGYNLSKVPLLCDNESAIHFLRDHKQKRDVNVCHISTDHQLADIFTKPLDEKRFCKLRTELIVLDSWNLD